MNKEPRTMQVADAATASRAPENAPAKVKKLGKPANKVHVHFSYHCVQSAGKHASDGKENR